METLRLRWTFGLPAPVRRLRRVLRAGLADPHYGPLLRAGGWESPAAICEITSMESVLETLPFTKFAQLSDTEWRAPEVMAHPLLPGVRAAMVPKQPGKARFTALAGSLPRLRSMAELPVRQRPEAQYGLLALFRPGEAPPSAGDRELLWKAFQVPVYGLLVGFDGEMLAYECEAQHGLHATDHAIFEHFRGRVYVTSLADVRRPVIRMDMAIAGSLSKDSCGCGRMGLLIHAHAAQAFEVPA